MRGIFAPFGVYLSEDNEIYLEPDISVICDTQKITSKVCKGAPDWIIEVVSPSSRTRDYATKLYKYHDYGVREYWIVDPNKNRTWVYSFFAENMEEYSFEEEIPVGIYPGFSINLSKPNA